MDGNEQASDFESVKNRLAEIADAVDDENLPLDDALDLYEEAIALGLQASDLLETGIAPLDGEREGQAGSEQSVEVVESAAGEPVPADTGTASDDRA